MHSYPITGRKDASSVESMSNLNSSPILYAKNSSQRSFIKSHQSNQMRSKSQRSLQQTSRSKSAKGGKHLESPDYKQPTPFSKMFKTLYHKINELYPSFANVANANSIHHRLQPDDLVRAQQVYNQLSFLYNRAIENPDECRDADHDAGNMSVRAANNEINILRFQLENTQRETNYYQKQMEVFKDQLQVAAMRERESENEYEQRLKVFADQVKNYEVRIDQMRDKIAELETDKLARLKTTEASAADISFRAQQEEAFKAVNKQPGKSSDPYIVTTTRNEEDHRQVTQL